jgi:hypothetical protein
MSMEYAKEVQAMTHRHITAANGPLEYAPPRITPVEDEPSFRRVTEIFRSMRLDALIPKITPTKAQLRAAVGELNAQAHACGRDEPSDCNSARATLEILIDALNIPEGDET